MAYTGLMEIDGTKFKVRHCTYSLHQNIDENGRPASQVMGGTLQLEIESSDDVSILEWMMDPIGKKNGSIVFSKTDEEGELRNINFTDAFLTSYTESMDAISNAPMTQNLVISSRELEINSVVHANVWEGKFS